MRKKATATWYPRDAAKLDIEETGTMLEIRRMDRFLRASVTPVSALTVAGFLLVTASLTAGCGPTGQSKGKQTVFATRYSFGDRFLGGGRYFGSWPSIAPSGQRIVFGSPTRVGAGDIVTADLDGANRKQLTSTPFYEGQPSFSPDGQMIVFVSEKEGVPKVYLMDADGKNVRPVTSGTFPDMSPVFAPDGSKILFTRHLSQNPDDLLANEIFSIDISGGNEKRLTKNRLADTPVLVSGDGNTLYYASGAMSMDLMKMDLGSGKSQVVLPFKLGWSCAISADEKWVAFEDDSEEPFEYEVHICQIDGKKKQRLTNFRGYMGEVSFGPNGKELIFVVEAKGAKTAGRGDIHIISTDGKNLRKVGRNW